MKFSREDADLFFELTWALQHFVNEQLRLLPNIATPEDYRKLPQEEKIKVRQALYDNIGLVERNDQARPILGQDEPLRNFGIYP